MGDGLGLNISVIGNSHYFFNASVVHLDGILHIPKIKKNILSVSKFSFDNNCYFEFHKFFYLVENQQFKKILFKGSLKQGLYILDFSKLQGSVSLPAASIFFFTTQYYV